MHVHTSMFLWMKLVPLISVCVLGLVLRSAVFSVSEWIWFLLAEPWDFTVQLVLSPATKQTKNEYMQSYTEICTWTGIVVQLCCKHWWVLCKQKYNGNCWIDWYMYSSLCRSNECVELVWRLMFESICCSSSFRCFLTSLSFCRTSE